MDNDYYPSNLTEDARGQHDRGQFHRLEMLQRRIHFGPAPAAKSAVAASPAPRRAELGALFYHLSVAGWMIGTDGWLRPLATGLACPVEKTVMRSAWIAR